MQFASSLLTYCYCDVFFNLAFEEAEGGWDLVASQPAEEEGGGEGGNLCLAHGSCESVCWCRFWFFQGLAEQRTYMYFFLLRISLCRLHRAVSSSSTRSQMWRRSKNQAPPPHDPQWCRQLSVSRLVPGHSSSSGWGIYIQSAFFYLTPTVMGFFPVSPQSSVMCPTVVIT